jgi:hypothetical protein
MIWLARYKLKRETLKAIKNVLGSEAEVDLMIYPKKTLARASTTLNMLKVPGQNLWSQVSYFQWVPKMQLLKMCQKIRTQDLELTKLHHLI